MKRGNLNIEYLIMMSILLVIIPLLFLALKNTTFSIKLNQANDAVGMLGITANAVHNLGPGNKESVWVNIPSDVKDTSVGGKDLVINLNVGDDVQDITKTVEPDLIGRIPSESGLRLIPVKAINDTLVKIGPGVVLLEIRPSCIEKNEMPKEIILIGDEFDANSKLLINDVEYFDIHSSGYVNFISSSEIRFLADQPYFESVPLGDPYTLKIKNPDGIISNPAIFKVVGNQNFC